MHSRLAMAAPGSARIGLSSTLRRACSRGFLRMRPAKSKFQVVTAAVVMLLFGLSIGCTGFFVNPTLTTITITPVTPSVPIAQTVQMTATGTFNDGSVKNITGSVSWSLTPSGFATITQAGSLKGVASGTTTLNAAQANITGSTNVTVLLANVISIQVTPSTQSVTAGSTIPYTATATLADGSKQDISSTATWTVVAAGTNQQPSCISVAQGTPFNVTDNGGCTPLPLTLNITASYAGNSGTTITSNTATLLVTS